jgi:hypothetical protein
MPIIKNEITDRDLGEKFNEVEIMVVHVTPSSQNFPERDVQIGFRVIEPDRNETLIFTTVNAAQLFRMTEEGEKWIAEHK